MRRKSSSGHNSMRHSYIRSVSDKETKTSKIVRKTNYKGEDISVKLYIEGKLVYEKYS